MDNMMPPEDEFPAEEPPATEEPAAQEPTPAEPTAPAELFEAGVNLAGRLTPEARVGLGAEVIEAFDQDRASSEKWRDEIMKGVELHDGVPPDKGNQENLVIMHYPFIARASQLFHSKIFPSLYPADGDILHVTCRNAAIADAVERVEQHMNHQINNLLPYRQIHDRGLRQTCLVGSGFETWSYDPVARRPRTVFHEMDDVVIQHTVNDPTHDMQGVERVSLRCRYSRRQLEDLEVTGYFGGVKDAPWSLEEHALYTGDDGIDETTGTVSGGDLPERPDSQPIRDASADTEASDDGGDGRRDVIEQDRFMVLPGESSLRPVTIWVDHESHSILRLALRERPDPASMRDRRVAAAEPPPVDPVAFEQLTGMAPEPPRKPPLRMLPWNRHTHYQFDVNPTGFYGRGIIHKVMPHNLNANRVATRAVSLLHASLLPTQVAARNSGFKGDVALKLGQIHVTDMSAEQVNAGAGLMQIKFPAPDPNWLRVVELEDKAAQEMTAFNITLGGESQSGQTATEAELQNSNALDGISMNGMRINSARAASFRNLLYINMITMPEDGEILYVEEEPDPMAPPDTAPAVGVREVRVTREDYELVYENDFAVTFTSDPRMESQPMREKRAMKLVNTVDQLMANGPAVDPTTFVAAKRAAVINLLEAMKLPAAKELIGMIKNAPMPNPMAAAGESDGSGGKGQAGEAPGGQPPSLAGDGPDPGPGGPSTEPLAGEEGPGDIPPG